MDLLPACSSCSDPLLLIPQARTLRHSPSAVAVFPFPDTALVPLLMGGRMMIIITLGRNNKWRGVPAIQKILSPVYNLRTCAPGMSLVPPRAVGPPPPVCLNLTPPEVALDVK